MSETLFRRLRIAAIPALLALLYASEVRHWLPAFRLFTFAFLFLLLAGVASLLRGGARDLILVAAALVLGLSLLEAAALILEPKRLVTVGPGFWGPRRELGWGPQGPGRFHAERVDQRNGAVIYSADYTIDAHLRRLTRSCETGPAVVFFGCSFTFGDGVNDADTMPQAFADLFDGRQRVLNLGFEAYGPQHFLRALQIGLFDSEIGPQPALFVFLTAPWHAERTSCKAPFTLDAPRYALARAAASSIRAPAPKDAAPAGCGAGLATAPSIAPPSIPFVSRVSSDDIEAYIRILLAAVDLARTKYGVQTVIPYIRAGADYLRGTGFDDEAIMARLGDGGAARLRRLARQRRGDPEKRSNSPATAIPRRSAIRLRALLLKSYIERNLSVLPSPPGNASIKSGASSTRRFIRPPRARRSRAADANVSRCNGSVRIGVLVEPVCLSSARRPAASHGTARPRQRRFPAQEDRPPPTLKSGRSPRDGRESLRPHGARYRRRAGAALAEASGVQDRAPCLA